MRALFEDRFVLDDLKSLGAGVALVVRDFSEERAQAARLLNKLGIPVSAWLLLPGEQGTWLDRADSAQAAELYQALIHWSGVKGLRWSAIGYGVPEREERAAQKSTNGLTASAAISTLIERAHADGFAVELVYSLPQGAPSQIKNLGLGRKTMPEVPKAERCIHLPPNINETSRAFREGGADGKGAVRVVNARKSLNLGTSTDEEPKTWQEFARELCAARQQSSAVYVITLESCANQGFLDRLVTLDWNGQARSGQEIPNAAVRRGPTGGQKSRWLGIATMAGFVGAALLVTRKKKRKD
ncbi:MAG TPA: LPXTG cell wall anchor domain-containing protein [Anaerolineaceae bacterium]|nr:LPXTG cell wall anchor domain-containing protein [Anaerolineaceae bacterium]